jgi:hypothetical protein
VADITGTWEFHRACPAETMYISGISDTGALVGSSIDNVPINGNYNAATNAISFNDARRPGETLFVSFYTGYVIPNEEGGACAMAGTYQEAELIFEESSIDRDRDIAAVGPGLTVAYPTIHAAWYAIWQFPVIQ